MWIRPDDRLGGIKLPMLHSPRCIASSFAVEFVQRDPVFDVDQVLSSGVGIPHEARWLSRGSTAFEAVGVNKEVGGKGDVAE